MLCNFLPNTDSFKSEIAVDARQNDGNSSNTANSVSIFYLLKLHRIFM